MARKWSNLNLPWRTPLCHRQRHQQVPRVALQLERGRAPLCPLPDLQVSGA